MISIIEVYPNGTALVRTRDLYQVETVPGGEVLKVLLDQKSAQQAADTYNGSHRMGSQAIVKPMAQVAPETKGGRA